LELEPSHPRVSPTAPGVSPAPLLLACGPAVLSCGPAPAAVGRVICGDFARIQSSKSRKSCDLTTKTMRKEAGMGMVKPQSRIGDLLARIEMFAEA